MPIDFDALKIRQELDLGDFNEQLRGQTLDVWVNLSYRVRRKINGDEKLPEEEYQKLYSDIWGLDAEEADRIFQDTDPVLFEWLLTQTWSMIAAYGEERKKVERA